MTDAFVSNVIHPEARLIYYSNCFERDYLLQKRGTDYYALFNDGSEEKIDPVTGTPRPDPDLADRTKFLRVPGQARDAQPTRVTPSKFSGLMRKAVACYLATGYDVPFGYKWEKTHGIVNIGDRYWVVEISTQGVFAAKVTVDPDQCCGSWRVDRYLTPPSTELSLASRWQNFDRVNVQRVLRADQVATVYQALGTPWCEDHGWAFSASGVQAQAVLMNTGSSPVGHYLGSRVMIQFERLAEGLTAKLTIPERELPYTLLFKRTVWVPAGNGIWTGADAPTGNEDPNPFDYFPVQDAPIHVYYSGETAQITRWGLTYTQVPVVESGNQSAQLFNLPEIAHGFSCYPPKNGTMYSPGYVIVPWTKFSAYVSINAGFSGPGFVHVGDNYTRTYNERSYREGADYQDAVSSFTNFFTLAEECYYYNGTTLVTACSCDFEGQSTYRDLGPTSKDTTQIRSMLAAVVLFWEDREAILAVNNDRTAESGSQSTSLIITQRVRQKVWPVASNSGCPCYSYDHGDSQQVGQPDPVIPPTSSVVNSGAGTGQAVLALADLVLSEALLTDADGVVSSSVFLPFLSFNPDNPVALSNVTAMHGNKDTAENYLASLTGLALETGFAPSADGELLAFIGKL